VATAHRESRDAIEDGVVMAEHAAEE